MHAAADVCVCVHVSVGVLVCTCLVYLTLCHQNIYVCERKRICKYLGPSWVRHVKSIIIVYYGNVASGLCLFKQGTKLLQFTSKHKNG